MIEEKLFNLEGVPVGSYRARRPLSKKEREWAAAFCDELVKSFKQRRQGEMGKTNTVEFTNIVALAGNVKKMKIQEEDSAFFLLDVTGQESGGATKWIPCTVYKEPDLTVRLDRYGEGDFIMVRGYVRAWSQKKDGEWRNAVDIRVTEIKSKDPEKKERKQESRKREPGEEDGGEGKWPF